MQVQVRAQGNNRSIESAYAFLQGLYPAEYNTRAMMSNQTAFALPQMTIEDDILSEVQSTLETVPVPFNI